MRLVAAWTPLPLRAGLACEPIRSWLQWAPANAFAPFTLIARRIDAGRAHGIHGWTAPHHSIVDVLSASSAVSARCSASLVLIRRALLTCYAAGLTRLVRVLANRAISADCVRNRAALSYLVLACRTALAHFAGGCAALRLILVFLALGAAAGALVCSKAAGAALESCHRARRAVASDGTRLAS